MRFWIWSLICIGASGISVFPRLFRPVVTEGQLEKQSFVVHLSESILRGEWSRGFPMRFFVELWHPGPIPWAEEFPLYHGLAAGFARVFGGNVVWAGRALSFAFAGLLLFGLFRLALAVFPGDRNRAWFAAALLAAFPGFQIYSTSVMPDLAMTALIVWGLAYGLEGRTGKALGALGLACLFKYYAVFALAAWVGWSFFGARGFRARSGVLVQGALAAVPVLGFLAWFLQAGIPNPITEYRAGNGYGHLAGPMLLHPRFYLRALLWIFVKNPGLPGGLLFLGGIAALIFRRNRDARVALMAWFLGFQLFFALVFASSFFVHDYYALPFLIPAAILGAGVVPGGARARAAVLTLVLGVGMGMAWHSTAPQLNYFDAAREVRACLADLPDRAPQASVLFGSDFAVSPIAVLSQKAGWTFNLARYRERLPELRTKLADPAVQVLVLYAREEDAATLFSGIMGLDPAWMQARVISERHYPAEGPRGSATALRILRR